MPTGSWDEWQFRCPCFDQSATSPKLALNVSTYNIFCSAISENIEYILSFSIEGRIGGSREVKNKY